MPDACMPISSAGQQFRWAVIECASMHHDRIVLYTAVGLNSRGVGCRACKLTPIFAAFAARQVVGGNKKRSSIIHIIVYLEFFLKEPSIKIRIMTYSYNMF